MMTLKQQIEEVRAGAKKPTCFNDLLELQQKLDDLLAPRQKRERTIPDICMSAIAEIVEFNEETKESHKTWAKHEYDAEKEKEEAIDILFFTCQLINNLDKHEEYKLYVEKSSYPHSKLIFDMIELLTWIRAGDFSDGINITQILLRLGGIYHGLGISRKEVFERYWSKWNENLDRIGKGKDGKGWL